MRFATFFTLLLSSLASARPSLRQRQSPCTPGLNCTISPLVDPSGTPAPCATHADTTANATVTPSFTIPSTTAVPTASPCVGSTNSSGAQTSLTLLSSVIAANFAQNGLNTNTSEAGEVASLTSSNNFINFCATLPDLPITNGQQLKNGSCNPAPMGAIPSASNIPSAKFVTPANLAVIPSNVTFQVILAVRNLAAGYFVNPDTNFLAAPQQLDPSTGLIQGHTHIVIEALQSLNQTTPTDPTKFAFFLGLNSKVDASGQLYANVTGGLPKGTYRMSTLTAAMNHQPVVLPVAQRGVSDDTIYFTVTDTNQSTNTTTTTPTTLPQSSQSATTSSAVPSITAAPTQTATATDSC